MEEIQNEIYKSNFVRDNASADAFDGTADVLWRNLHYMLGTRILDGLLLDGVYQGF